MKTSPSYRIPLLIAGAILLLTALFYAFYSPSYDWYQHSYDELDDEPYGADLSYHYLKQLRDADRFHVLDSSLSINLKSIPEGKAQNYLLFGYMPYLDSASLESIESFVITGNSLFMFSEYLAPELLSRLHEGECLYYEEALLDVQENELNIEIEAVDMRFRDTRLQESDPHHFSHMVKDKERFYQWAYLDPDYFCPENSTFEELGTMNGQVNFARVKMGEGYLYLHTNPKVMSNYYLLRPEGQRYMEKVMAYLDEGDLYWDSKRWSSPDQERIFNRDRYQRQDGALTYMLSQESFRWALGLLFLGALSFLIIGTRRKQRVIPILATKENSSMHYVDTLSALYYAQNSDGRIFRFLSEQFLFFARERYRIHVNWENEENWSLLAKASGIPLTQIKSLRDMRARGAYEPNVTNPILSEFYQRLESFYSECK